EVRHTEHGTEILENFVLNVCKLSNTWSLSEFLEKQIETIKNAIGDKKAIVALSGGVDSSVAAVLTYKAIGSNLKAVFVDHGLLRLNEETEVKRIFRDAIGLDLTVVDAKKRFLDKLAGVTDPEKKRKIIGEEFIRVFEDEAKKDPEIKYLIQGTILRRYRKCCIWKKDRKNKISPQCRRTSGTHGS
ncbi:MAG TPA: 7-cyano-7-deazaguanine synthase, partial [Petrotogaceae bacterium]|nr:7-cyano-7-deazaguanine synthase [Petrotogaceae bacterium]